MAAEKKTDTEETPPEGKGKKSKGKLLFLIAALLLILGGGGFGAYTFYFQKPAETTEPEEPTATAAQDLEKLVGTMYPMEPFLVNIDDSEQTRFLKTSLTLEFNGEDVRPEIEKRIAQIRDTILLLLSSKGFSDVRTSDGKYILREEILERLNSILVTGQVSNVYFTEFVVQ
ncbi:MAG: flagellar basal body-associated FliL family protein [bacterium]|nr:flagellar basal body-associated FliL family protein [bacterium]